MMKVRKGFTLVELLIVIVIIGILAAAMMLSTGSATAAAEASNIISELRNLKAASMMLFADSMDAFLTTGTGRASVNGATDAVGDYLSRYMDNSAKFIGSQYAFKITEATIDTGVMATKWFVGFNLASSTPEVRQKLTSRARTVGLFGSGAVANAPTDITTGFYVESQSVIWTVAR